MTDDRRTHVAFAGAVLIGGANFIAVSVSNHELPPLYGATVRFALAAALFLLIARAVDAPWPRGRALLGPALYGLLGFGFAYAFLYYALVGLAAGTVSVIVAAAPLATLLLAVVIGQERLTARGAAGGVLAMAGIGVLSWGTLGAGSGGTYVVAAILSTLAIAGSSVIARGCRAVHPVHMNAVGMVAGTALLAAGSLALEGGWTVPRERATWVAVAWLVLLGSVGLFQLFLYVVRRWSASATVYAVAAMPVVAAGLGVVLLDQPVTGTLVVGGVMVMAAVYVGAIAGARRATADGAPAR